MHGILNGNQNVGGISGLNHGLLYQCSVEADITEIYKVGGLCGFNRNTIKRSFSRGRITSESYVGGLIGDTYKGYKISVYDSYTTANVVGKMRARPICGDYDTSSIMNCYSANTVNGEETYQFNESGIYRTKAEMQTASTFLDYDWDFIGETNNGTEDIWRMCEDGIDYPRLTWEFPDGDFQCPDGINLPDFTYLASHWQHIDCNADNNYCDITDINRSGSVDIEDLVYLGQRWLEGVN